MFNYPRVMVTIVKWTQRITILVHLLTLPIIISATITQGKSVQHKQYVSHVITALVSPCAMALVPCIFHSEKYLLRYKWANSIHVQKQAMATSFPILSGSMMCHYTGNHTHYVYYLCIQLVHRWKRDTFANSAYKCFYKKDRTLKYNPGK
jgi:hypothetical protein